MKIILVKLFLLVIFCDGEEDNPCNGAQTCVPKKSCASYRSDLANLRKLNKCCSKYKTLLTKLKTLICDKKAGKVCCMDPRFAVLDEEEEYECGLRKVAVPNIAGGEGTRPGDWPWMARLLYPGGYPERCGGTLVSSRHVVTAAHCVAKVKPDMVRLGETILSTEYDCLYPDFCKQEIREEENFYGMKECYEENECAPKHVDIRVRRLVSHESFSWCPDDGSCFPQFDVALVTLESPVVFSPYIQPLCLPPIGASVEYNYLVVTGWGNTNTEFGAPFKEADVLQKLDIFHETTENCNLAWRSTGIVNEDLLASHVCATTKKSTSTCRGDSGGPLVRLANYRTGGYELAGITSFGVMQCGDDSLPLGFTKVAGEVGSWLRDHMGSQNLPLAK